MASTARRGRQVETFPATWLISSQWLAHVVEDAEGDSGREREIWGIYSLDTT